MGYMKRFIFFATFILFGCSTAEMLAKYDPLRLCYAYTTGKTGLFSESDVYAEISSRGINCADYTQQMQIRAQQRAAAPVVIYQAPTNIYTPAQTPAMPPPQRPINCYTTRTGKDLYTTCY
jgi:hypothetical protein